MRKALLLLAVFAACAKNDAPADTAAAAPAPAPAPPALTAADLAGTWNGHTMPANSDSVLVRWTLSQVNDSVGVLKFEGTRDSVMFTRRLDADSLIAESRPYRSPIAPRGSPLTTFYSVGRLSGGTLRGTVVHRLATNADSVVNRGRWEATRATP